MTTYPECVFLKLSKKWHDGFIRVGQDEVSSRNLDEIALSALLLVREFGFGFTDLAREQIEKNILLATARHRNPWVDSLIWNIALEMTGRGYSQMEELVRNLNHHNSVLRIWFMEIAWTIGPNLRYPFRDSAFQFLMENVANTLSGIEIAWGLAATLYDSAELFYAAAEDWHPTSFMEQYTKRVKLLKDTGILFTQAEFWKLECRCRSLINESALDFEFN